jgi:imidazolonepropionase-like amidohydrolase
MRHRIHSLAACVATALFSLTVAAAAGPGAGAQTVAITGGTVYPVSGPRIENGTVLIAMGGSSPWGANVAVPADARRIDASGKIVTPGLVNAGTQLGVVEIGSVASTRDAAAQGKEGIAASFVVTDGFNPRSVLLAPARQDGITSAVVIPAAGLSPVRPGSSTSPAGADATRRAR